MMHSFHNTEGVFLSLVHVLKCMELLSKELQLGNWHTIAFIMPHLGSEVKVNTEDSTGQTFQKRTTINIMLSLIASCGDLHKDDNVFH